MAMKAMKGRPLDVEALGARMRLYPYNNVCEKRILFTPQYFDLPERELLQSRMRPDMVFIRHRRQYRRLQPVRRGRGGRPRSDPGDRTAAPKFSSALVFNIRQNPFATIKAVACAVADRDCEITLFIDPDNRGETSMRIINSDAIGERVKVPAKALTTIIRQEGFAAIDAMKLDVEGAEDLILEPFFQAAPEALWPKLLLIEFAPERWAIDLPGLLVARGYRLLMKTRQKATYERP